MASYNELNALIDAYINRNGVQAITGQILNGVLKAMVEQLGRGYTIMGAAIPTTDPGTPDGPECYFASAPGTYTDFDGLQVVPGELALLCYTPTDGWTKETIYEGFQTVQASIDGNVGTPSVGVSYADGVLSFDFHNMKGNPGQNGQDGQDGAAAGFGTIGADITGGVGTPGVTVESSGPATAKNLQFHFTNLKGETGVTSVVATVDNTVGTPACTVSLVGQQLTLAFSGLKGAQGNTGVSADYPIAIVNNLTTNDPASALSAAQGVVLDGKVTQLEAKADELDGVVKPLDDSFDHITKWAENRLNPATCASGLINSAGTIFTGGSYDAYTYTDYIRVKPGATYTIQYGQATIILGRQILNISRHCFFNENKVLVSGSDTAASSVTIPLTGVSFIRFCCYRTLANITAQYVAFIEGTTIKDFVPYEDDSYSLILKAEANNKPYIEGIVDEKLSETKFGPDNTDASLGENAFDKDALVQGTNYWVNTFSWNGSDSTNNSYFSALFPVKPNRQYLFWQGENRVGVRSVNEYDADGNFISGTAVGNAYIVKTGANTAFLKCSFVTGSESVVKVEPVVQNGATARAFIPSSLYCAVGRTIEMYNSQVCITKGINVQWRIVNPTTNAIRPLKRKLQVIGNATGEAVAVFVAYDDNKNVLFAGTTRIYFVSATLSTTKSIVPVGDSLTNGKVWLAEVERLSGNKIGYVGEYPWGLDDSDGDMQTGGHEGRSGFSAKDYATGAVYTYGGETTPNKWWNGTRFSLTAFETATSITPDMVQLWVGVNGLSDDNAENANYIKTLVDNIRLDNATIPIFVCVTPFKGDQNAIGLQGSVDGFVAGVSAWKYNEDFKIMDLMKRIYTIFSSGYTNVHIIDLAISMDSEYNYGWQEVAVNPRAVQTEHIQTDSVHPQAQGYFQIADILYSNYCAVLNA